MKKILYIATTADSRNRLDGETIKCRLLREYLREIENIELVSVDTDNWKKHKLKLVFLIIYNFIFCNSMTILADLNTITVTQGSKKSIIFNL